VAGYAIFNKYCIGGMKVQDKLWQDFLATGSINAFLDYSNFVKLGFTPNEGENAYI